MTAFITSLCSIALVLYFIWNLEKRSPYLSYIFLTLCIVCVYLSSGVIASFGVLLIIALLFIRRYWPASFGFDPKRRKIAAVFYLSMLTGTLLAMFWIFPSAMSLIRGASSADAFRQGGLLTRWGFVLFVIVALSLRGFISLNPLTR